MAEIQRMREQEGATFQQISDSIEERMCRYDGRNFRKSAFFKRKWTMDKCRRLYYAWLGLISQQSSPSRS